MKCTRVESIDTREQQPTELENENEKAVSLCHGAGP